MTSTISKQIAGQIIDFLKPGEQSISLHEPRFLGNERDYVQSCLDEGMVSSIGKYVDRFEQNLAQYTGSKHAIATTNGTAALHTALRLCDVGPETEVLVQSLTFIATINAISYCHATPHFIEVHPETLSVDPFLLKKYLSTQIKKNKKPIKALIVMHTYGNPSQLKEIAQVCDEFEISMIEDAAESLGSFYEGRHTGCFGKAAALSFNGNKIITTGGGGAVLTQDSALAKRAKHLTTTAKSPTPSWRHEHDDIGFNYRLPNLNAALGCAQLEQINKLLRQKRKLAMSYQGLFESSTELDFFKELPSSQSNYWLNTIILKEKNKGLAQAVVEQLQSFNILARGSWQPNHLSKMYRDCPKMDLTLTESLAERIINLPSSPFLADLVR